MTLFGEAPGLLLDWVFYIGCAMVWFWLFWLGWQTSAWLHRNGYYERIADNWTALDSIVLSVMVYGAIIYAMAMIWRAL